MDSALCALDTLLRLSTQIVAHWNAFKWLCSLESLYNKAFSLYTDFFCAYLTMHLQKWLAYHRNKCNLKLFKK